MATDLLQTRRRPGPGSGPPPPPKEKAARRVSTSKALVSASTIDYTSGAPPDPFVFISQNIRPRVDWMCGAHKGTMCGARLK